MEQLSKFGSLIADGLAGATGLTLGLVAHPAVLPSGSSTQTLSHLPGSFLLELVRDDVGGVAGVTPASDGDGWKPRWTVWTSANTTVVAEASKGCVLPGAGNIIKATYNSTSRQASVFVNNTQVAASPALPFEPQHRRSGQERAATLATAPSLPAILFGAENAAVSSGFEGALEEIYLKNVSTESREAYIYTDNVRPDPAEKVYVFDLARQTGRDYFARVMSKMLDAEGNNYDATQWDGFEVLFVIGGGDFKRSSATARSSIYRGTPSPDWYNLGWPMQWGQGVLEGMEDVMRLANNNTAVECSFMAPGLGTWRPDMVPYVDQRDNYGGLIGLGLRWHSKMLFRTEISGTIVNPYHTPLTWIQNATEIEYWLGGMVTGGVAPQVSELFNGSVTVTAFDAPVKRWFDAYAAFGHMIEGGLSTVRYDTTCCHTQGECEWDICSDVIASRLVGGTAAVGVYVGSGQHAVVPVQYTPMDNATVLVFAAWTVPVVDLAIGVPAATHLRVVATSSAPSRSIGVRGGFLTSKRAGEHVVVTTVDASGTVIAKQTVRSGGAGEEMKVTFKAPLLSVTTFERVPPGVAP